MSTVPPAPASAPAAIAAPAAANPPASSASGHGADDTKHDAAAVSNNSAAAAAAKTAPADATAAAGAAEQQQQQQQAGGAVAPSSSSSSRAPRRRGERSKVHAFKVNGSRFIIDARYAPIRALGRGAYGVVCSAQDTDTDAKVAIKKVQSGFDDVVDGKRILREVKMLHHFRHENIIGLLDVVDPPPGHPFDDIYLVLEYMETDLHKIIYSKNELTDHHIQYFMYQVRPLKRTDLIKS